MAKKLMFAMLRTRGDGDGGGEEDEDCIEIVPLLKDISEVSIQKGTTITFNGQSKLFTHNPSETIEAFKNRILETVTFW